MTAVFLRIVNVGTTASFVIAAVILMRFFFRRAPRRMICALWGLVALRLIVPFSIESPFSLLPSATPVSDVAEIVSGGEAAIEPEAASLTFAKSEQAAITPFEPSAVSEPSETAASASPDADEVIAASASPVDAVAESAAEPTRSLECASLSGEAAQTDALAVCAWVWVAIASALLVFEIGSYLATRISLRTAIRREDNVWQSERVSSPFIFGLIRPRIYLPYRLDESVEKYVLAHERTHLRRFDHAVKPLAFALCAAYWFNPLVWAAYVLLCRDVEFACDESVIRDLDEAERRNYAAALLAIGSGRSIRNTVICPLAFGTGSVKERIEKVLSNKKVSAALIAALVAAVGVTAAVFLTDPIDAKDGGEKPSAEAAVSETETEAETEADAEVESETDAEVETETELAEPETKKPKETKANAGTNDKSKDKKDKKDEATGTEADPETASAEPSANESGEPNTPNTGDIQPGQRVETEIVTCVVTRVVEVPKEPEEPQKRVANVLLGTMNAAKTRDYMGAFSGESYRIDDTAAFGAMQSYVLSQNGFSYAPDVSAMWYDPYTVLLTSAAAYRDFVANFPASSAGFVYDHPAYGDSFFASNVLAIRIRYGHTNLAGAMDAHAFYNVSNEGNKAYYIRVFGSVDGDAEPELLPYATYIAIPREDIRDAAKVRYENWIEHVYTTNNDLPVVNANGVYTLSWDQSTSGGLAEAICEKLNAYGAEMYRTGALMFRGYSAYRDYIKTLPFERMWSREYPADEYGDRRRDDHYASLPDPASDPKLLQAVKGDVFIVMPVVAGSGSIGHRFDGVEIVGSKVIVNMTVIEPECGTCDMHYGVTVMSIDGSKVPSNATVEVRRTTVRPDAGE